MGIRAYDRRHDALHRSEMFSCTDGASSAKTHMGIQVPNNLRIFSFRFERRTDFFPTHVIMMIANIRSSKCIKTKFQLNQFFCCEFCGDVVVVR